MTAPVSHPRAATPEVERVAKAISDEVLRQNPGLRLNGNGSLIALAAMEALERPSQVMIDATQQTGGEMSPGISPRMAAEAWRMMIDKALGR